MGISRPRSDGRSLEAVNRAKTNYRKRNRQKLSASSRQLWFDRKVEVLTRYGRAGRCQCSWDGCDVVDPDMLSLDHINNDGAKEKREGRSGTGLYLRVVRENFPKGFQTLCHNHQWKKEILRRRQIWIDREKV